MSAQLLEGDMVADVEAGGIDRHATTKVMDYRSPRANLAGNYLANNGYGLAHAQTALRDGEADLSFRRAVPGKTGSGALISGGSALKRRRSVDVLRRR